MRHLVGVVLLLASALAACAAHGRQDVAAVKRAVEEFLSVQVQGLPGSASVTVGGIDSQNNLAPCAVLEAFTPPGARPWGRTTVGVRCRAEANWSVFVPVQIRLSADYVVAARPLAAGQVLMNEDLLLARGDLGALPPGVLTDPEQAVGRTVTIGLPAGRPLRAELLRQPILIQQGQTVKIVSRGAGFQVSTDGRALNSAVTGQVTQVRTGSGQTVSGIARGQGVVEVSY